MLDEAEAVQGLGALGAAAALKLVVEMQASLMMRHLGHGMVETDLEWLHGSEVLEVRISQDVSLKQFL